MRALSVFSFLLFSALWGYYLAAGGALLSPAGMVAGLLLLLSAGASLLNLGDRYVLDEGGIAYSNPILSRLGLRLERRVPWPDVVSVRAHRGWSHGFRESAPSALFLQLATGGRFVIDSVDEMAEIGRLIGLHLAGAGREGAMTRAVAPVPKDPR